MQTLQDQAGQQKIINYLIKFGISAVLLILIFRTVNLQEALVSLSLVSFPALIIALLLQLASTSVAAYRWFLIMRTIGSTEEFFFFLKSYFKGTFFNQGLPTSIGGDGIRILDCSRSTGSAHDGFYGVFIDRFAGLAGLLVLNIGALLLSGDILPSRIRYLLLVILSLLLVVLVVLLYLRRFRLFTRTRWLGFVGQLSERYFQVYSTPSLIGIQLSLSIITHLFSMTAIYVLGISTGLNYPLSVYLVLVPPVILLTILPVSLAGWGVREGAMIGFFLLIGADQTKVLSFSLLYGILVLFHSLPGLLVYLAQKNKL